MKSRKRKEPGYGVLHHEMTILKNATEEQQSRAIEHMTVEDALKFDADFESWAHRNQLPPGGEGWRIWLMLAGRGFGKTRAGAEWIFRLGEGKPRARIALIGATISDARNVMVEGVSGLLSVAAIQAPAALGAEPVAIVLAERKRRGAVFGRPCGRPSRAGA